MTESLSYLALGLLFHIYAELKKSKFCSMLGTVYILLSIASSTSVHEFIAGWRGE